MRQRTRCSAPTGCRPRKATFHSMSARTGQRLPLWTVHGRRRLCSASVRRRIMSGFEIFAWIVLIILVACVIGVFCIAGWLPGHIAKTRGHPQAQAVMVAGWVTLICGFALWPVALIWAYVDVPAPKASEGPR